MARRSRWARRSRSTHIDAAPAEPGLYRTVTGAESLALGLVAGAQLAGLNMFFGSYPITPASPLLHHLSRLKEFGITTFQAEDEIAAICSAIGASYAGQLGDHLVVGPGHRAQDRGDRPRGDDRAAAGRSSIRSAAGRRPAFRPRPSSRTSTRRSTAATRDAPLPVIAARSPADAFECAIEAVPHRDPLHDPGDAADRRLYRQCRRAVESARHERLRAVPGRVPRHAAGGRRGGHALRPQRRPRAAVDQAGHAGPRASHRRDREGAGHRATSITAPKRMPR